MNLFQLDNEILMKDLAYMLPVPKAKMENNMIDFSLLRKTGIPLLKNSLNAYAKRHEAIAQNIAHLDTPSYKPIKVSFEENLQKELMNKKTVVAKSHPRHINIGRNTVEVEETLSTQNERVNIEDEMAELAKNRIRFEFATKVLARKYQLLRSAILGQPS